VRVDFSIGSGGKKNGFHKSTITICVYLA